MIFGIASYHRPECKTIDTLLGAGVEPEKIYVSIQDATELEEYKKRHPSVNFLFRETDCLSGNRNTLLNGISERPICLLDDDITGFSYYNGEKFVKDTKGVLESLKKAVEVGKRNDAQFVTVAANSNSIIARNRPEISVDAISQGTVLIMLSNELRFDERFKMVQDYELCLRTIYSNKHYIRFNRYVALKPKNGTNKGGLHEAYLKGENYKWHKILAKKYPIYKVNKQGNGGMIKWK